MGRKNRIYPKDWLIYKPYTVPDQVDRYYVGLANEVMNLLENSEVSGFFSGHPELMRKAGEQGDTAMMERLARINDKHRKALRLLSCRCGTQSV